MRPKRRRALSRKAFGLMQDSRKSELRGASTPPLIEHCIGKALDIAAARWGSREALVACHQGIRWTFSELHEKVEILAAQLLELGLRPGDRVGLLSQNNAEWVLVQFATAKAGLIQVNINPAYRTSELGYVLNKVACRAVIIAPTFKSSNYVEMLRELAPEIGHSAPGMLKAENLPSLKWIINLGEAQFLGIINYNDLMKPPTLDALSRLRKIESGLSSSDPINIQFTSGTTGAPKAATLTHRNILNNGFFVGEAVRLGESDKICIPVPLYHCFGMVMANLACIVHGSCMVQPDDHFNSNAVLAAISSERCTVLYGVPTMFIALLDDPGFGDWDLLSLRTGIMAGSPCPMAVMRKVVTQMHMEEITIAYGMTETSPVSFQSAWDDLLEIRVASVGRLQPHLEAKIVDEEGRVVQRGAEGELLVRGYSVMTGYWEDAPATAHAIDHDGWIHTGDLASIDEEGLCRIVGRSKDMVIRGGENIYPTEVEGYLHRHPKIRDVQCIGIPDPRFGEELCACIIPHTGSSVTLEEIRAFCSGKIAHYKIPRYIYVMQNFPMTVTGKVQKYLLRDIVSDALCRKPVG